MAFVTPSNSVFTSEWFELAEVKLPRFNFQAYLKTAASFSDERLCCMFHKDMQNPASSSFPVISGIALSEHTYCSHTVGVMEIVLHWQPCSHTFC